MLGSRLAGKTECVQEHIVQISFNTTLVRASWRVTICLQFARVDLSTLLHSSKTLNIRVAGDMETAEVFTGIVSQLQVISVGVDQCGKQGLD